MTTGTRVTVVGYASLDSSTATREFRGIDATSILERPIVSAEPGIGGIAHLTNAVVATGAQTDAVSWVGDDSRGRLWTRSVAAHGSGTAGVVTAGTRTPSATMIEIGAGGTICLFDPGDCHPGQLSAEQVDVVVASDWVLLTVAPRQLTMQLLDVLPTRARLVWAVKHDEDAYTQAIVRRLLGRVDIVSFSHGERPYLTIDGIEPERMVRRGGLVIETRGADGVVWSFGSATGAERHGRLSVERVDAHDTTGAGDTFVGALVGLASTQAPLDTLTDEETTHIVTTASKAAGDMLRARAAAGQPTGTLQKETH